MQTKLHINVSQGVIDVEGDTSLVREVYNDFRDKLLTGFASRSESPPEDAKPAAESQRAKSKRQQNVRKKARTDSEEAGVDADNPRLDYALDTSKLPAFYEKFEPRNHPEKILIFAKFLTDELGIASPNTDQFYTCYSHIKERIPKAFAQAFRDTSKPPYGYINYKSASDISVTIHGTNHFNNGVKRKVTE